MFITLSDYIIAKSGHGGWRDSSVFKSEHLLLNLEDLRQDFSAFVLKLANTSDFSFRETDTPFSTPGHTYEIYT